MITVNGVTVKERKCDTYRNKITISDGDYWSEEPMDISGDIELINHITRIGTITRACVRPNRPFDVIESQGRTIATLNNSVLEELVQEYPYKDTVFYVIDTVLVGITIEHRLHLGTVFEFNGLKLMAFNMTITGLPIVIQNEDVKESLFNFIVENEDDIELPGFPLKKS